MTSPARAVVYGATRGVSMGIMSQLLDAGLAFAAFGVQREEIGRVLGVNTWCTGGGDRGVVRSGF